MATTGIATHETIPEVQRRLHLLKELLEVQQRLVAANLEQAILLRQVSTLESRLVAGTKKAPVWMLVSW
jgi:hypothetical protein